ncbi:uncharacterized protein LOC121770513 [Salvia splendens]|uniref:uncharacterized protein LOC121770513 n=1 Tax=Salvia splendens TaxID=180675 RepID=UPI001C27B3E1|nr:uncharacterized protein LOC121770513 [Salvia splendens]
MIIATWNVRGLQQLPTQAAIVDFVRTHKIDVMGLLETKYKKENYTFFLKNNFREWKAMENFEMIENSRMLLMWNPSKVTLEPIRVEEQAIYTKIRCLTSNNTFHFVLVYGLHTIPVIDPLWDSLVKHVVKDEPTLVSSDFNNVLAEDERVEGSVHTEYEIKNMVDTCALLGLEDIMSMGCKYTCKNHAISSKIDRAMINDAWFTKGYVASTEFLPSRPYTDHSPTVTTLFEFKKHLKQFNIKEFSELSKRVKETGEKLEALQKQADRDTSDLALRVQITNQKKKTAYLEKFEREYFKQKAIFKHLLLSDRSTSFFHSLVKRNNSRNYIAFLYRRDGTITRDQEEIISEFVKFYSTLLGTKKEPEPIKVDICRQGPLVSEEDSRVMVRPITVEEIKEALFDIGNDKAPGPDGYSSAFFKKQWERVGKDVVEEVKEFFEKGQLLKNFNTTVISLIPKTSINPTVGDYRSFSYCYVFYKIFTKIRSRRMAPLLKLVDNAQSAFIPGRHIMDNIHLAQGLIRGYAEKKNAPKCTVKISDPSYMC